MISENAPVEEHPAARAAAEWWAVQIGAPTFKMVSGKEDRREREAGDLAGMMGLMLASANPVDDEQGKCFVEALTGTLSERLQHTNWVSLGVDYGPDIELANAAAAAGVSTSRFPWKTHMSVTPNYVTAALGYGAQHRLIWQAPDWKRPACGTQLYVELPDGDYEPRDEVCPKLRYHEGEHGDWIPDPNRCKECGGTYVDHYGRVDGQRTHLGHSWQPEMKS